MNRMDVFKKISTKGDENLAFLEAGGKVIKSSNQVYANKISHSKGIVTVAKFECIKLNK